ncbi:MAG: hypothetical protein PHY12_13505, partial [Eubacteriales bacterium]|nr:hypothetical protein [Eubacteriales bacterium]
WQGRWRPVCSAGLNVALSIWWVGPWGIEGVLAATIVSRLLTTWWFDPWMVHHYALHESCKGYFLQTLLVLAVSAALGAGLLALRAAVFAKATILSLIVLALLCLLLPNAVFWLLFHRKEEYRYLLAQLKKLLQRA